MLGFKKHRGYEHPEDDRSASSSEEVFSSTPPPHFPEPKPELEAELSSTDALMDLAATIPSSEVVSKMEEKKTAEEDEEVQRIVSAVTEDLRKPTKRSSFKKKKRSTKSSKIINPIKPPRSSQTRRQRTGSKDPVVVEPNKPAEKASTTMPEERVSTSSPEVPVVSDEETDLPSRAVDLSLDSTSYTADTPTTTTYTADKSNIVDDDDESYSDSSDSSSGSSSYSSDSSSDDGSSTASLTEDVDTSYDDLNTTITSHELSEDISYRRNKKAPQGLDIVGYLLSGAKEINFDAFSVTGHSDARDVSEALAFSNTLEKVSFSGPWKGQSNKARQILEVLFDGLLKNSSLHTLVLKDNDSLDRYAGYAFGTFLKAHNSHGSSRFQKLEISNCKFAGSGWNSLFLGLQYSTTIKKLFIEDCTNLDSDDVDCITSTIQYLEMEYLKLVNIGLHTMKTENLAFLLRAIQQTKTLKEVDLSRNNLGAHPKAILLLSRCMSGDDVSIERGRHNQRETLAASYQHHIEKLTLVDCGITDKSSVRMLCTALDSKSSKLDVNLNEHPLKLHTLDVSANKFGNSGCRFFEKLLEDNPSITHLGMIGCGVGASHLKKIADGLRYNNSFLQKIGLSSGVSLAILDSVSAVEKVFTGQTTNAQSTADLGTLADEDDASDLVATSRMNSWGC